MFDTMKNATDIMGFVFDRGLIKGWTTVRSGKKINVRIQMVNGWRNLTEIDLHHFGVSK